MTKRSNSRPYKELIKIAEATLDKAALKELAMHSNHEVARAVACNPCFDVLSMDEDVITDGAAAVRAHPLIVESYAKHTDSQFLLSRLALSSIPSVVLAVLNNPSFQISDLSEDDAKEMRSYWSDIACIDGIAGAEGPSFEVDSRLTEIAEGDSVTFTQDSPDNDLGLS